MLQLIIRLVEILVILWLARLAFRYLLTAAGGGTTSNQTSAGRARASRGPRSPESRVVSGGEMKKDPQCGTYVSTELSLKTKYNGDVLHFCSPECQEQYLKAHSGKSA